MPLPGSCFTLPSSYNIPALGTGLIPFHRRLTPTLACARYPKGGWNRLPATCELVFTGPLKRRLQDRFLTRPGYSCLARFQQGTFWIDMACKKCAVQIPLSLYATRTAMMPLGEALFAHGSTVTALGQASPSGVNLDNGCVSACSRTHEVVHEHARSTQGNGFPVASLSCLIRKPFKWIRIQEDRRRMRFLHWLRNAGPPRCAYSERMFARKLAHS